MTLPERQLANAIRALAMDAVQAANSGHPGMPMGMADVATVLYSDYLKYDPADPAWAGIDALFTVVDDGGNQRLRSNSPGAANYQISTPSALASDARWEWEMDLRFSTSGANYVDVYLMADNADLTLAQNGWFVRVGGTADRVELFKRVVGVNASVLVSPPRSRKSGV